MSKAKKQGPLGPKQRWSVGRKQEVFRVFPFIEQSRFVPVRASVAVICQYKPDQSNGMADIDQRKSALPP